MAITGNQVAGFESMLQPVLPLAYGVAHRLTGNPDDAEDVVQEAALQALRGFGTFEPGTNFKAWFLRVMTNCFFARCRKRKREPQQVDLDDAPPLFLFQSTLADGLHRDSTDPAAELLGRLEVEQVAAAIRALPEEFRVVCVLYFLDELPYQEIAEILGCPVGTVRSRLHRGRRLLQKVLWCVAKDEGIVQRAHETPVSPGSSAGEGP